MRIEEKQKLAQLRRWRTRNKIAGTGERPRMSVKFTNKNIYVQFIDDQAGVTLVAASTRGKPAPAAKSGANIASAARLGALAAEAAKAKGINRIVFDRGAAQYHGKVKALADAARAGGLQF